MRLANRLVPNAKIAVIDTENESASLYASDFDFDVIGVEPPYTIDKIVNPVKEALDQKYDVIIVDSAFQLVKVW